MSDRKFVLPPSNGVTLSEEAVQKLIACGNGNAALVYLYILKNGGHFSLTDAAAVLRMPAAAVEAAMLLLSSMQLVDFTSEAQVPAAPKAPEELPTYSIEDIRRELEQGQAFAFLVQDVQRSLGKILSSDDLMKLFGIYDSLGLPPEVILLLVTHCKREYAQKYGPSRLPTMRFIEKSAYIWERNGLFTMELAEAYLQRLIAHRDAASEIKAVLQIRDRELTPSEQRYVDAWLAMGFSPSAIAIAFDRTVISTGKLVWKYMHSILTNWDSKGLHTPAQIQASDTFREKKGTPPSNPKQRQSAGRATGGPTAAEMQRMQAVLNKIKQGS